MKNKKIIITIFCLVIVTVTLLFLLQGSQSKDKTNNVRGFLDSRLNYVPKSNASVDKYISELQYQVQGNSNSTSLYCKLGAAYLQKARETSDPTYYSRAEENLLKANELSDKNFEAMYQLGTLSLARHNFEEAIEWGNKAKEINPYNSAIRGVIFDALIETGKYDEAERTLQEMVDLKPDLNAYSRISYYRELRGDIEGAITAMRTAIKCGGPNAENTAWCRVQLGNLYLNQQQLDSAEAQYQTAIVEFPYFYQALLSLGKLQLIRNDLEGAVDMYKNAIESNPTPDIMIALGDVYKIMGDNQKAEELYQDVRFINTVFKQNGVDTDIELALFEADHNTDLKGALKDAEASMIKRPTIKAANTLAWLQYKTGNYFEAEKNIQFALKLGTKDPLMYYHAGKIYERVGEPEKARQYLEYALKINPQLKILIN